MPQLGLSNSSTKGKVFAPRIYYYETFDSGTGGYSTQDAALLNSSNTLRVTVDEDEGYAHKAVTVIPSTKYYYRVRMAGIQAGGGDKFFMIGTGAGDDTFVGVTTNSTGTYSGSFTTGGSTTAVTISLMVSNSGKYAKWDDILIETYDDQDV
tara:strand:+ start:2814 stop:3269 length:456 start_codon:yes stop_codon:yes gene_type:complete